MIDHKFRAERRHGSGSSPRPGQVLLCAMPFGLPYMPSLGLSLLKAELADRGIAADVRYFGLDFADTIGYRFYQRIAHAAASHLGDWIFHASLSGPPTQQQDELFWREVFPDRSARGLDANFAAVQHRVADAQRKASEFVERCADEVDWARYRIVGFSTMFQQNIASLAWAQRIKQRHPEMLLCDSIQPRRDVARALEMDEQATTPKCAYTRFIDEMQRRGFLVQENDRVLSLVVLQRNEGQIPPHFRRNG